MRWMMLMMLAACEPGAESLDTGFGALPLQCPPGEGYRVVSRLCDARPQELYDQDTAYATSPWRLRRDRECVWRDEMFPWVLHAYPDRAEWVHLEYDRVIEYMWTVEPASSGLPERLILRPVGHELWCSPGANPAVILLRDDDV